MGLLSSLTRRIPLERALVALEDGMPSVVGSYVGSELDLQSLALKSQESFKGMLNEGSSTLSQGKATYGEGLVKRIPLVISGSQINSQGKPEKFAELHFLVNPSNMDYSMDLGKEKIKTMGGFLRYTWRNAQATLTVSGATGGFYVGEKREVTYIDRKSSRNYKFLRRLVELYKNNGVTFQDHEPYLPERRIAIDLQYGDKLYSGFFTSFSEQETAKSPYKIDYSFTFIVEKEFPSLEGELALSNLFDGQSVGLVRSPLEVE